MSIPSTESVRKAFVEHYTNYGWEEEGVGLDFDRWLARVKADQQYLTTANPPPGWFHLGYHANQPDVLLEFWGEDVALDGMPIWERPLS